MARVSDVHVDQVHTCKNWDAIHNWAQKHATTTKFDVWTTVDDDLEYPANPFDNVIQRFTHVDLHELKHNNFSWVDSQRPHHDAANPAGLLP